jgi:hypothetical protein
MKELDYGWCNRPSARRQYCRNTNGSSAAQGPVDVIAVNDEGEISVLDAKKQSRRVNPGRKCLSRIHLARTAAQKRLGARIAYVDIESRNVHIVPPIGKTVTHRNDAL